MLVTLLQNIWDCLHFNSSETVVTRVSLRMVTEEKKVTFHCIPTFLDSLYCTENILHIIQMCI
jgi:hypothetical protein